MKFTDGHWEVKDGVNISVPMDIRDISITGGILKLFVATRPVRHRGDTLGGPMLTFEYSSPFPDVICVKVYRFKGVAVKGPAYELYNTEGFLPQIEQNEEVITFTTGKLSISVKKSVGWEMDIRHEGKRITGNAHRNTGYITVEGQGSYFREQLDLGVGEYLYGLGERFTPFVKTGLIMIMQQVLSYTFLN